MIAMPLSIIPLAEGIEDINFNEKGKLLIVLYTIAVCAGIIWNGHIFVNNFVLEELQGGITEYKALPNTLLEYIPSEDRDSVVGYNIVVSTYLAWDIKPCYKYFHHQDWQGNKSVELMERIREEYQTCEAKWIIAEDDKNGISDILEKHYEVVIQSEIEGVTYNLYRRISDVSINNLQNTLLGQNYYV